MSVYIIKSKVLCIRIKSCSTVVCYVIAVFGRLHAVLHKHEARPVPNVAQLTAFALSVRRYLLCFVKSVHQVATQL